MSFEMDMLSMYHVHHLSTEIAGQISTKVPKSTPENTNQDSAMILLEDVKYNCSIFQLWPNY